MQKLEKELEWMDMKSFWTIFNKNARSFNKKNNSRRVYLDSAASTKINAQVLVAMTPFLTTDFGNPSSFHQEGVRARQAVEKARTDIKNILNTKGGEVIFTSGGTEANNLALLGTIKSYCKQIGQTTGTVLCSDIEHHSVLEPLKKQSSLLNNVVIKKIKVNHLGEFDLNHFKELLNKVDQPIIVSVGYANNEIGTIFPIKDIAKLIRKKRKETGSVWPLLHVDACQAPRFLSLDVTRLGVDLMTLNSSKIYGPKGVGLLYVGPKVQLEPVLSGGGQEFGLWPGTENVAGIVGLAKALSLCATQKEKAGQQINKICQYLKNSLDSQIPNLVFHGLGQNRLPHNLNVTFLGVDSEQMAIELDHHGFAVSVGSACSSNKKSDSHVLKALYGDKAPVESSVRFTLDSATTLSDIDELIKILPPIIERHRSLNN